MEQYAIVCPLFYIFNKIITVSWSFIKQLNFNISHCGAK